MTVVLGFLRGQQQYFDLEALFTSRALGDDLDFPGRAVVLEAILLVGGLLFARFLATGALATAVGVWGFLLVQSCWFLVAGIATRACTTARGRRARRY